MRICFMFSKLCTTLYSICFFFVAIVAIYYYDVAHLDSELKLSKGFHEWHSLNVTDRTSKFNDAHFRLNITLHRLLRDTFYPFLNCVGHMGHNCEEFIDRKEEDFS